MGGSTEGTLSGNDSVAAAAIKLDFPVPRSPATTIRTLVRTPVFAAIGTARNREESEKLVRWMHTIEGHYVGNIGPREFNLNPTMKITFCAHKFRKVKISISPIHF